MTVNYRKAPFPWFGGKSKAAPAVWAALCDVYAVDSLSVAHDVREWCLANGDNPRYRIVLAGFNVEHGTALADAGWSEVEWFTAGFLSGGMGNTNTTGGGHQQDRERLWCSPHCVPPATQGALF